ncbi:MAG: two-component regulator propeller domain-containing protein [Dyadobacter sp.]|uniref:hybrid sensor histidine kinase/response regulator transcription factor n=1 Tax=Dyadobacter sp. TaxID=1914288 RepID=UPI0032634AB8
MIQFALRYLLALVLVLMNEIAVFGQSPMLETISTPPGFDAHEIADIRQDKQGYLWLATGSGLLRFDGYNWKVYQHDAQNGNSLASDNIRAVCPTRDGLVWTGGWSSGLDCLNPESGKITHHPLIKGKQYRYEDNAISALLEDHLGNLWVGTVGGLYRLEKKTGNFIAYLSVAKNARTLSHSHISSIYEDRQGTLWVGTGDQGSPNPFEGGLNKLDRKTETFTRYLHSPTDPGTLVENRVLAIFEDSRGTFWVGTGGDGLHTFDRKSGRFTRYPFQQADTDRLSRPFPKEKNLRSFPTSGIRFIQEDPAGGIWIGTMDAGANRYDPLTQRVTSYRTPAEGLADFNLFSACRARDGTLWMGTIPGHLIKVLTTKSLVKKVKMRSGVHYFQEDSSGLLWMGTISGLVAGEAVTKGAGKWFERVKEQTQLLTDHVTRLNTDQQANRWISTWNNGLYFYERSSGQFTHYEHDSSNASSMSPGEAAGFYQDRSGTNWVLTAGGLDKLDRRLRKFSHYRHRDRDSTSISNNYILSVLEDHAGQFWVGTNGGGLNLMDRLTGKFKHFLPWSIVTQLVEDASGRLWVTSSLGLHYYDRGRGIFVSFADPDSGKPLAFVKAMVEDNQGNLWIAMSSGIAAINSNRKTMRLFGRNYGIPIGEDFFFGGSYKRRDGSIYFGSMDRYFHFQPEVLLKDQPVPPLLNFSAFRVHNQLMSPAAQSFELSYKQNVFSIDFAAIDFRHPELHLYTYKLENYDLQWHPLSAERTANYFNVPPGSYNFHLRAANSDGIWVEKSMPILISPPWWRTAWAYGLYALVLAGLFFGGWQLLLRGERAKSALKIREIKAQQLLEMDRLKSDFFANITHEFRTPLTLILSPLEHWLSSLPSESPYASQFKSMQRNGRRLLHLVNQLLDLSKLEAGKMQLDAQPGDLIYFVDRITASFSAMAQSRGITYQVSVPQGNLWLYFDADKLEKILNNLLSNAFKFTPDNGRVTVSLLLVANLEEQKKTSEKPNILVELKVTDSGSGIPTEQLERIFDRFHQLGNSGDRQAEGSGIGLALTRELVELHQGAITVLSAVGQGSEFVVSLPLEMLHAAQSGQLSSLASQVTRAVSGFTDQHLSSVWEQSQQQSGNAHSDAPIVLVVEDNADLRSFICQSLSEHLVYRLLEAADGEAGYLLAQRHIPDLVISDIMMPKMDGIIMCQRLKTDEKTSHIPVILLTAKTATENKVHGLQTGADEYLTKPFEVKELLARIDNLIRGRRLLKERYTRQLTLQPSNIAITSTDEQFLTRAMRIIEQYMADEQFSVDVFGREIGMSRMQLYRKLNALTGQSPSDFIRTIRLQRAAQLLSAHSGTVSQIADQVGFGSHSYFSKCFQELYGKTPSAFLAELDTAL